MANLYQYRFREAIDFNAIEDTLLLATAAVEGLHSSARVAMDLRDWSEPDNGAVIIDEAQGDQHGVPAAVARAGT